MNVTVTLIDMIVTLIDVTVTLIDVTVTRHWCDSDTH